MIQVGALRHKVPIGPPNPPQFPLIQVKEWSTLAIMSEKMSDLLQLRLLEDLSLRPLDIQRAQLQVLIQLHKILLKHGHSLEWILGPFGSISQQQMPLEEPLSTSTPTS